MLAILFQLLIAAVVVGVILYLLQLIPGIDPPIIQVIRVVIIAAFIIYILYVLYGLVAGGPHPALPR